MHRNAKKIAQSIELHCEGNPFKCDTPLKNLASSALIGDVKLDILQYSSKGQKAFEDFVKERLLPSPPITI